MPPDEWQSQLLRTAAEHMLLLCSRQAGKSTVAAALALRVALLEPRSPILILSPTDRQSSEVVDLLLVAGLAARVVPVTITAGQRVTSDGRGGANVPKKDLVAAVQAALRDQRLEVAASLPLAQVLVRELETFTVKITDAGNETFGADKDRSHDDLVLAVSLALWASENASGTAP
jgi:hypothetical protein